MGCVVGAVIVVVVDRRGRWLLLRHDIHSTSTVPTGRKHSRCNRDLHLLNETITVASDSDSWRNDVLLPQNSYIGLHLQVDQLIQLGHHHITGAEGRIQVMSKLYGSGKRRKFAYFVERWQGGQQGAQSFRFRSLTGF